LQVFAEKPLVVEIEHAVQVFSLLSTHFLHFWNYSGSNLKNNERVGRSITE